MAEASGFKFELTAGNNMPGAPRFSCTGVMAQNHTVEVEKAEITQALPPPNGVTPITKGKGNWSEEATEDKKFLLVFIQGEIDPEKQQPIEVPFDSRFEFPLMGPLKAGETLKGEGIMTYDGKKIGEVPAELKLS